jgi:hypothetical protein
MSVRREPLVRGEQCTATARGTGERCRRRVIGGTVCVKHGGGAPQVRAKRLERIALAEELAAHPHKHPADVLLAALRLSDLLTKRALEAVDAGERVTPKLMRALGDASARSAALARAVLSAEAEAVRAKSGNDLVARQLGHALEGFMAGVGLSGDTNAECALADAVERVASASWMPLNAAADQRLVRLAEDQVNLFASVVSSVLGALGLEGDAWVNAAVAAAIRAGGRGEQPDTSAPPRSWWAVLVRRGCAELGLPDPTVPPEILPPLRRALTDGRSS